jgi:hypothetical protein
VFLVFNLPQLEFTMWSFISKTALMIAAGVVAGASWLMFSDAEKYKPVLESLFESAPCNLGDLSSCKMRFMLSRTEIDMNYFATEDSLTVKAPINVLGRILYTSEAKVHAFTTFKGKVGLEVVGVTPEVVRVRVKSTGLKADVKYTVLDNSDLISLKDTSVLNVAKKQEAAVIQSASIRGVQSALEQRYPGRKFVVVL